MEYQSDVYIRKIKPSRKQARDDIYRLGEAFSCFFETKGYIRHNPVLISSGIDPTTYFIGSHISVFKPYLQNSVIPSPGYYLVQDCIRTQNLNLYFSGDKDFEWASFFTSLGLLTPSYRPDEVYLDAMKYLLSLGLDEDDIRIRVCSTHADLLYASEGTWIKREVDTMPQTYYRHKLGLEDIFGRNLNIALRKRGTSKFADVGNVIVIEKDGTPVATELALGTSTILKQAYGLDHIMDCFNINGLEKVKPNMRRKMEDAILVVVTLYREGLRPGSKGKNRLLGQYLKSISYFKRKSMLSMESLQKTINNFETSDFPITETSVTGEIIDYICRFERKPSLNKVFYTKFGGYE